MGHQLNKLGCNLVVCPLKIKWKYGRNSSGVTFVMMGLIMLEVMGKLVNSLTNQVVSHSPMNRFSGVFELLEIPSVVSFFEWFIQERGQMKDCLIMILCATVRNVIYSHWLSIHCVHLGDSCT